MTPARWQLSRLDGKELHFWSGKSLRARRYIGGNFRRPSGMAIRMKNSIALIFRHCEYRGAINFSYLMGPAHQRSASEMMFTIGHSFVRCEPCICAGAALLWIANS